MPKCNKLGGSGRSPICSRCGEQKDPSFMTSGYCRGCKSQKDKDRRMRAREALGLRPLGSGRSLHCYTCGKLKEHAKAGYCNGCEAARDRIRRLKNVQSEEFVLREREKVVARCKDDPIFKIKKDIHNLTNSATRLGILDRQPCEVCGVTKVDAHHDDYNKPMEVRWLCRKHHNEHHRIHGEAILPHALIESLKERNLL